MRRARKLFCLGLALGVITALPGPALAGPAGQGTKGRDWVSGPEAPPESMSTAQYQVIVERAVIPARDGELLQAQLYLPALPPGEEPGPCVVETDGYSPPSPIGALTGGAGTIQFRDLASRGYATAYVWLRSVTAPADEGLYYRYGQDGYDVIEWMAQQSWCDGNVGMIGGSLLGISQWLAAKARPPHLKAIVPTIACGDCYWYLWYRGGTLPGSGREGRRMPVTATQEYDAAIQHRDYDAWWQRRGTTLAQHRAIAESGIAVLECNGWDDYFVGPNTRAYEQLLDSGGTGMNVIGPCAHGGPTYESVPYDFDTLTVLWFDRFLKGIRNGIDRGPSALIYVKGPDQYRFEERLPIPDTRWTKLFLRAAKSGTVESINDGSLTPGRPGAGERSAAYRYSPDGPFNNAGGGSARPTADQRSNEANSLTWTSSRLDVPTELTGWPRLTFYASSSAGDTDFVAELTDVAPDGTSRQIGRGWLNAPRYFDRRDPEPLVKGRVYRFTVEMWPMSYVFEKGHRLRVDLSGSDSPGTGENPNPARVTVYQDAAHSSFVELPVIGTSWRALLAGGGGPPPSIPAQAPAGARSMTLVGLVAGLALLGLGRLRRRHRAP